MSRFDWPLLFFVVVCGYCLLYAPYGINETDGGFITGLAWQVLQGKTLYADLVYVRPPLPVWLRALELQLLPANGTILGERWLFYIQVALYCWLAADVLSTGNRRWQLALFGFIVSTHTYPAAAWHTVDGILFAVFAVWLLFRLPNRWGAFLAGLALTAALLCKQSFYPLALAGLVAAWFSPNGRSAAGWLLLGLLTGSTLFLHYLYQHQLVDGFLKLTGGTATGGEAWQHGVLDFFRINPLVLGWSLLLLPVAYWSWRKKKAALAYGLWIAWITAMIGCYVYTVWLNQDFTPPFAQARLLFWLGCAYWFFCQWKNQPDRVFQAAFGFLLAVSWCSAISWGYNLPILFALPGVWAVLEFGRLLRERTIYQSRPIFKVGLSGLALLALLGVFRYGYEFVYRDGRRSAMTEELGSIFPALNGIRSNPETAALYRELKTLAAQYGPNFTVLPAFPLANFLMNTPSPLPLNWVVAREMNADSALVLQVLKNRNPVLLVEKRDLGRFDTDPELSLLRPVIRSAVQLPGSAHFLVFRVPD